MGWIDENNHVYILIRVEKLAAELNWDNSEYCGCN